LQALHEALEIARLVLVAVQLRKHLPDVELATIYELRREAREERLVERRRHLVALQVLDVDRGHAIERAWRQLRVELELHLEG
jgi:hypothetical protein